MFATRNGARPGADVAMRRLMQQRRRSGWYSAARYVAATKGAPCRVYSSSNSSQ